MSGSTGLMTPALSGGDERGRMNLICLSEGYLSTEFSLFEKHCLQLAERIDRQKWYQPGLLNVHKIWTPSARSARELQVNGGPLSRIEGVQHGTPYGAQYGGDRQPHVLHGDGERVHEALDRHWGSRGPKIAAVLVNNSRHGGNGGGKGGGMFWTFTDVNNPTRWTSCALHEFGHVLGLADEYESPVSARNPTSPRTGEPQQPNITIDGRGAKWRHLVDGAVEGGDGYSLGIFRPTKNCLMRSLMAEFCPVCVDHIRLELEGHLLEPLVGPPEELDDDEPEIVQPMFTVVHQRETARFPDNISGAIECLQWILGRLYGK